MHKEVNHKIRKHFNEGIYNVARYTEIVLSIVISAIVSAMTIGGKAFMKKIDPKAFITTNEVTEVLGNGFKKIQ